MQVRGAGGAGGGLRCRLHHLQVDGGVEFTGVLGNRFRVEVVEGEGEHVGPASPLPAIPRLPGGQSLGLGIRYLHT